MNISIRAATEADAAVVALLGRGAGLPLLRASLASAVAVRAPAVWLAVLRQNDRANRFYDKHGFAPVGPHRFVIGAQSFDFAVLSRQPA